jgi:putative chitinase
MSLGPSFRISDFLGRIRSKPVPLLSVELVMAGAGCTEARARQFLPHIERTMVRYDITTPPRISAFLAQIGHESAGLTRFEENLNYSVAGLAMFVRWGRMTQADANRLGRAPGRPADQQAIANIIYGGEWGRRNLGNTEPGDGWRCRGRGPKQLTGRRNYTRCGQALGLDLVGHPDLLLEPEHAMASAGWFWSDNRCNALADAGQFEALTERINGGTLGLTERTALRDRALRFLA